MPAMPLAFFGVPRRVVMVFRPPLQWDKPVRPWYVGRPLRPLQRLGLNESMLAPQRLHSIGGEADTRNCMKLHEIA